MRTAVRFGMHRHRHLFADESVHDAASAERRNVSPKRTNDVLGRNKTLLGRKEHPTKRSAIALTTTVYINSLGVVLW